jgi:ELWxxDGT repeat protein
MTIPIPNSPVYFAVLGNKVLFQAQSGNNDASLWVTDGTGPGTYELTNIVGADLASPGLAPRYLTTFGNEVLTQRLPSAQAIPEAPPSGVGTVATTRPVVGSTF